MRYSDFQFDGRHVSKLGFGAMGFADWFGAHDERSYIQALHYALGAGITFVDTARAYGQSEAVVGRALRSWPGEPPIVATKVEFDADLTMADLATTIDELEVDIRAAEPRATLIFIEPDVYREPAG